MTHIFIIAHNLLIFILIRVEMIHFGNQRLPAIAEKCNVQPDAHLGMGFANNNGMIVNLREVM